MDRAADTLFYPFVTGRLEWPAGQAAFLGARAHTFLEPFKPDGIFLQQSFKPYARALQDQGYPVSSEIPAEKNGYSTVCILLPKNAVEARALVAAGFLMLQNGGLLLCAANNRAGGERAAKILKETGFKDVQHVTKNHARCAWGFRRGADDTVAEALLHEGSAGAVAGLGFVSQPGLFSWNKIDKGSELLAQQLPETLAGAGADFGCGYGYLSRHVLQHCSGVTSLCCVDADYRGLKVCRKNLKEFKMPVRYMWEDLTQPAGEISNLDWIVMNPPFHEGKATDADIGSAFIKSASLALRFGGQLWMVANAQLPYETALGKFFSKVTKKYEGQGYKIYCAEK